MALMVAALGRIGAGDFRDALVVVLAIAVEGVAAAAWRARVARSSR
jgi:hypothetical protein